MITAHTVITITCDSQHSCDRMMTFEGESRFDAVNKARTAGWYMAGANFSLCPVHDNGRMIELEHRRQQLATKELS